MGNGCVMDKKDSNQGRIIDVSQVGSVTGFERVKKYLTDLPEQNEHGTDMQYFKCIENGH